MLQGHQYARLERERRFLLDRFPTDQIAVRSRRITDYYVDRTTLRLREMQDDGGPRVFKLTQKIAKRESGAQQGFITSMHLTEDEFRVLAQLPAKKLHKIRYNVPPFGVDVFKGGLEGLFLAEAEFDSAVEAESLALPSFVFHEVSHDERFTGGELVRASRENLQAWLLEYGIRLKSS